MIEQFRQLSGKLSDRAELGAYDQIEAWRVKWTQVRVHKTIRHPACGATTLSKLQICAAYSIDPVSVLDDFWDHWGGENGR